MSYFALTQYALALAFSLGFLPSSLQAQQLQQPASVLPWASAQPEMKLALRPPRSPNTDADDSPAWLLDSAKKPAKATPKSNGLHMVETERFVDLGPLDEEPNQASASPPRKNRSFGSNRSRPLSFLRALGIRTNRSGTRN